ncbi:Uncharacterised protein [Staphylococcus aureus]|uniref:Uncharacterized protein n=1 Tax=Staphylococcus aureus TaxID=1280 RepID=A0A380DTL7_STAAU|nr:Uncharacterised protein [Staphylococcus aureus]
MHLHANGIDQSKVRESIRLAIHRYAKVNINERLSF